MAMTEAEKRARSEERQKQRWAEQEAQDKALIKLMESRGGFVKAEEVEETYKGSISRLRWIKLYHLDLPNRERYLATREALGRLVAEEIARRTKRPPTTCEVIASCSDCGRKCSVPEMYCEDSGFYCVDCWSEEEADN